METPQELLESYRVMLKIVRSQEKTFSQMLHLFVVAFTLTLFLAFIFLYLWTVDQKPAQVVESNITPETKVIIIMIPFQSTVETYEEEIPIEPSIEEDLIENETDEQVELVQVPKTFTSKETIDIFVEEIANKYKLDKGLIQSIIEKESKYNPDAQNGQFKGLMQISAQWQKERMNRLGVTNLMDPYENILTGSDYLATLISEYQPVELALMVYNSGAKAAVEEYNTTGPSNYAKDILQRAKELGE